MTFFLYLTRYWTDKILAERALLICPRVLGFVLEMRKPIGAGGFVPPSGLGGKSDVRIKIRMITTEQSKDFSITGKEFHLQEE